MAAAVSVKYCLLFAALLLSLCLKEGASGSLSKKQVEDELEIERKLNNKLPIKTIHTEWGDILDCFDINKQPAFDHPLLKNHKIQMKSSFSLNDDKKSLKTQSSIFKLSDEECPEGTVPILRIRRESSIKAVETDNTRSDGHSLAGVKYSVAGETFYGAFAELAVYNPKLSSEDQFSSAEIAVENGPDSIRVGWTVNPSIYGDHNTRIFTMWTTDKTGCYDAKCSPGFIQTDPSVHPGIPFTNTSVIGSGKQIVAAFVLYQHQGTGNWFLRVQGDGDYIDVGYWPKELFGSLSEGCNQIYWGGNVKESANRISPEMGSGQSPNVGDIDYGTSCYYTRLQYMDKSGTFLNIKQNHASDVLECSGLCRNRYTEIYLGFKKEQELGHTFLFGGPGGAA